MKNIFLTFKFIDNNNRKCSKYTFEVYLDDKLDEWKMSDDASEKHMHEIIKHVQHIHEIKEYIKNHLNRSFFNGSGEMFNGYKFIKEKCVKISENINMTPEQPILQSTIRRVKHIEKICLKFMSGNKPQNWTEIFNYQKSEHHFYFYLEKNSDGSISYNIISPDTGKNGLIVPHKHSLTKERNSSTYMQSRPNTVVPGSQNVQGSQNVPGSQSTQGTQGVQNDYYRNNSLSATTVGYNNVNASRYSQPQNQTGGGSNDYKYLKYKKKYLNTKNKNQ